MIQRCGCFRDFVNPTVHNNILHSSSVFCRDCSWNRLIRCSAACDGIHFAEIGWGCITRLPIKTSRLANHQQRWDHLFHVNLLMCDQEFNLLLEPQTICMDTNKWIGKKGSSKGVKFCGVATQSWVVHLACTMQCAISRKKTKPASGIPKMFNIKDTSISPYVYGPVTIGVPITSRQAQEVWSFQSVLDCCVIHFNDAKLAKVGPKSGQSGLECTAWMAAHSWYRCSSVSFVALQNLESVEADMPAAPLRSSVVWHPTIEASRGHPKGTFSKTCFFILFVCQTAGSEIQGSLYGHAQQLFDNTLAYWDFAIGVSNLFYLSQAWKKIGNHNTATKSD